MPGRAKRADGTHAQDTRASEPAIPAAEPGGAIVCIRRAGCGCHDCKQVGAIEAAMQKERLRASMKLLEQQESEQDAAAPTEVLPHAATPANAAPAVDARSRRVLVDEDAASLASPAVPTVGERDPDELQQDPSILGVRRLSQAEPGGWSQWGQDSEEEEGAGGDEGLKRGVKCESKHDDGGCESKQDDDARVVEKVDTRDTPTPNVACSEDSVPPATTAGRGVQPAQQHGPAPVSPAECKLEPGTGGDQEEASRGGGKEEGQPDQVLPSGCAGDGCAAGDAHAQASAAPSPAAHAPRPSPSAPFVEQEEERAQAGVQKEGQARGQEEVRQEEARQEEVRGAQTISDLLRSRSWKERLQALDMLKDKTASAACTLSDDVSDTYREEVGLVVRAVGDSNVAVQERALDAALSLLPTVPPGLMETWGSEVAGVAIDKAFGQSKCKGKAQHVLLALLGRRECSAAVLDLLCAACAHKQPKVATSRCLFHPVSLVSRAKSLR